MSYATDNLGLLRSNTASASVAGGVVNENTVASYANLFYPYLLDNAGNDRIVSLTIDVMNKGKIEPPSVEPNAEWINQDRYRNSIGQSPEIWAFGEAYHGSKFSRAISNAFCFGGQELTFYFAVEGDGSGYVGDQWLYAETKITLSAVNLSTGAETQLYIFEDLSSDKDDSSRYLTWNAPEIDNAFFSGYALFGLVVLRLDIERTYYEDAGKTIFYSEALPYVNQAHLQLLVYSGAREMIDVDVSDMDILNETPLATDSLEQIFSKTIFESISAQNLNPLTSAQKRAIIADQVAVAFMSQHPVIVADHYPGHIVGWGGESAIRPRKIVEDAVIYAQKYPEIVPLVIDRLFGMIATYKAYNFVEEIENIIADFKQSTQQTKDPIRAIYMDEDGVVSDDLGIDGIIFNPYGLQTENVEFLSKVTETYSATLPLYEATVDVSNIRVTDEGGSDLEPTGRKVLVNFDVVGGEANISRIKYVVTSDISSNYEVFIDSTGLLRSYLFSIYSELVEGDSVKVEIYVEDTAGGVTAYEGTSIVDGLSEDPALTDIEIYQRADGSGIVDVFYTYIGTAESNTAYVYIQFSTDDGVTWSAVSTDSAKGDVGNGVLPGRRRIWWEPEADLDSSELDSDIICRLTLYDVDGTIAIGDNVTGSLVWSIDKPVVSVRKVSPEEEEDLFFFSSSSSSSSSEEYSSSSSSSEQYSSSSSTSSSSSSSSELYSSSSSTSQSSSSSSELYSSSSSTSEAYSSSSFSSGPFDIRYNATGFTPSNYGGCFEFIGYFNGMPRYINGSGRPLWFDGTQYRIHVYFRAADFPLDPTNGGLIWTSDFEPAYLPGFVQKGCSSSSSSGP